MNNFFVVSNHVPCLCLNVRVNEIPRKTCESKYRLLFLRLCEDLSKLAHLSSPPAPSVIHFPILACASCPNSQVFSLFFCCGSLYAVYGVPINQGNYLALRFSVLEFTRESERQPIRGCKNYLRKKIWRGQKFVEEISSSLVAILHLRGQEVLWFIIRATLCIILVFGQQISEVPRTISNFRNYHININKKQS